MNGLVGPRDGVGEGLTIMKGVVSGDGVLLIGEAEKDLGLLTKMKGLGLGLEFVPKSESALARE